MFEITRTIHSNSERSEQFLVKFIYSEKATKFCEIFPLLLTTVHTAKSKGKISQIFCGLLRIHELYFLMNDSFIHTIDSGKFQTSLSTMYMDCVEYKPRLRKFLKLKLPLNTLRRKTFANPLQNTFFLVP